MYHLIVMQRCLQALALLDPDDPLARRTLAPAVRADGRLPHRHPVPGRRHSAARRRGARLRAAAARRSWRSPNASPAPAPRRRPTGVTSFADAGPARLPLAPPVGDLRRRPGVSRLPARARPGRLADRRSVVRRRLHRRRSRRARVHRPGARLGPLVARAQHDDHRRRRHLRGVRQLPRRRPRPHRVRHAALRDAVTRHARAVRRAAAV